MGILLSVLVTVFDEEVATSTMANAVVVRIRAFRRGCSCDACEQLIVQLDNINMIFGVATVGLCSYWTRRCRRGKGQASLVWFTGPSVQPLTGFTTAQIS